jgi:hypothetical protein
VAFGQNPFSCIAFGPKDKPPSSKKRTLEETQHNEITLFKRIRVVSRKIRVRTKPTSDPFTQHAASGSGFERLKPDVARPMSPTPSSVALAIPKIIYAASQAATHETAGDSSGGETAVKRTVLPEGVS